MGDKTGIEWTDATWNPIVGCTIVSPGCTNCYAMRQAARLEGMGVEHYAGLTTDTKAGPVWNGRVRMAPDEIVARPLSWRRPRRIFVNSMSDLFHEAVPDAWRDRVLAVMAQARHHTFQVLTKRSDIMRHYLSRFRLSPANDGWITRDGVRSEKVLRGEPMFSPARWPLPNVWWGVSVEDQPRARRLIDLAYTSAAVRWASLEPLVGAVDLTEIVSAASGNTFNALTGRWRDFAEAGAPLDWMVIGGESGPKARPMHPDWVRNLLSQGRGASTPVLFKQWGEWAPAAANTGKPGDGLMARVGKKAAGRMVDGALWDEYPATGKA